MDSPINKSYLDDYTFSKLIEEAKQSQLQNAKRRISEHDDIYKDEILSDFLAGTTKSKLRGKFKALKNARKKSL